MHLAFLTSEYPHPRTGPAAGIGTSIKNMAEAMAEKDIRISVFIYGQHENDIFTEGGIKFHLIRQQKFRFLGWYLHRKFLQNYLNKYIAVDCIDALEAPDWTGITAFMSLRCPLVIRMNGSDTYFCHLEKRPQKKKNFWFEKMALHGAEHLLSVSRFTAEETKRLFGVRREINIIPNSIDAKTFQSKTQEYTPNRILYFGSIIRKKGVLELPGIFQEVLKKAPEAELVLVGKDVKDRNTGRSTKELMEKEFSPEALKRVKWRGPMPYDRVLKEIAQAHVVVLPSFAEALPMTWIEAMAMEKALVTSDIGWAKEVMIDGETGFTVDPKEHEQYAAKILRLLKDPSLTKKMGKAARERVLEKFSTEVVVEKNITFYEGVVSGQRTEDGI
ncbi:Glycosyltransferase involved in cell wall bisynthesis [Salinimicrobium catena]|uniref:Glycosyltransferase involved in cell wall bisynthesis n=1 Tax=Salinimicrobium catena TaxID=390640 RepID=A0A1H5NBH6_9FLAO|nr:glycosyltransferase family 4 protein [Salinimicrobium catena]SDL41872.1 Glycosyltransferase involved in cell wall bisynthesis [Salinimicrobium catena]SEE98864.1 Glycosyltransferase involved in cell wall bisynthesis [Salinimicrobium catena]